MQLKPPMTTLLSMILLNVRQLLLLVNCLLTNVTLIYLVLILLIILMVMRKLYKDLCTKIILQDVLNECTSLLQTQVG